MDKIEPYGIPVIIDKSMKLMDMTLIRLPENYNSPFGMELRRYMCAVMDAYMSTLEQEIMFCGETTTAYVKAQEAADQVKAGWDFTALREATMEEKST